MDHPQLRDAKHIWPDGRWDGNNGLRKLTSINDFSKTDESWIWQEKFFRYIMARWGYCPAMGMWQTVLEINGTNAYDQFDNWHVRIHSYFYENNPYRHPTTASMSGDVNWPEGQKLWMCSRFMFTQ